MTVDVQALFATISLAVIQAVQQALGQGNKAPTPVNTEVVEASVQDEVSVITEGRAVQENLTWVDKLPTPVPTHLLPENWSLRWRVLLNSALSSGTHKLNQQAWLAVKHANPYSSQAAIYTKPSVLVVVGDFGWFHVLVTTLLTFEDSILRLEMITTLLQINSIKH